MIGRALLLQLALLPWPAARQTPSIPDDGPGAAVIRTRCVGCHEADLITTQRLTDVAWDREIAKMERWSAPLPAAERQQLLAYLTSRFGPESPRSVASGDAATGETVYRAACRSCHEDDLAAQQRLSAGAWRRTVDKMTRWGARVTDDQKDSLVAYLVSRWGPRR